VQARVDHGCLGVEARHVREPGRELRSQHARPAAEIERLRVLTTASAVERVDYGEEGGRVVT
jgi:hypothetical protein